MVTTDKILKKFLETPQNLNYKQIEKILFSFGYIRINAKWSHLKYKHKLIKDDLIFPIHNWDCKVYYKNRAKENILFLIKNNKWNTI